MESSNRSVGRESIESSSEKSKSQAGDSVETTKSNTSGLSKLLPGNRRKRKKKDKKQADDGAVDNDKDLLPSRSLDSRDGTSTASSINENPSVGENEVGNLLTDDSEPDRTPPLTTRNSHAGFYTTSSPLITTTTADETIAEVDDGIESTTSVEQALGTTSALLRAATQPASSLDVPNDRSSKKRSPSPARRLKDAFSSNQERDDSDDVSEQASEKSDKSKSSRSIFGGSSRRNSLSARRAQAKAGTTPAPAPALPNIRTDLTEPKPYDLQASPLPRTPPHTAIPAPLTRVTPPTPTDSNKGIPSILSSGVTESPESMGPKDANSGIVVSPSGNMISHRRARSTSSAHKPSKLSNSISALSPLEESKASSSRVPSIAQQSGFFSSVFSAAQSAASTISSSLNTQARPRNQAATASGTKDEKVPETETDDGNQSAGDGKSEERKSLAVDTLGSGDLDFSQLGIEMPSGVITTSDGLVITKPDVLSEKRKNMAVSQLDEEAAMLEDKHAARAVSLAYEKATEARAADDSGEIQPSPALPRDGNGDQTPPSGSIYEGDTSSGLARSGSVRSRLAQRRHRGSSGATTSTLGAIGATALALGIPGANSSMPRLTGFAVASKKRNRDFHQLFRSVPEDDYLIEDYSCALQREIILAGRIYISEGHICFSSNILGWVTTLVISFDEVVAIEKETTAMVFPNAIAIQTLHARHIFRSLLSRESTYELMVNIWKINHPALKSSVNGTRIANGSDNKTEKAEESDAECTESDEDEIYDEDEDRTIGESFYEPREGSLHGSDRSSSTKGISRKPSGNLQNGSGAASTPALNGNGESKGSPKTGAGDGSQDFPGPATHPPTEYNDPSCRYEKLVKDEIVPAPLGKVYSLVFGAQSGTFISKFLVDNQKSMELQFEVDKKGLTTENPTRQYSYIKPLNAPIGPKQTKCISTENLDFFDLEKAVLVTLSTQTPDVPSGNLFLTKTKYLFTWAAGNQTRFLMTCTIEWSGKTWLKGPIEKGAMDGQTTFGNELLKSLKTAVVPRSGAKPAKSGGKGKNRRKKGDTVSEEVVENSDLATADSAQSQTGSWGILEPLHGLLGPVVSLVKPLLTNNVAVLLILLLLIMVYFRSPTSSHMLPHEIGCPALSLPQRMAAYEEMWRHEESELWHWLEDRVGMDGMNFPTARRSLESHTRHKRLLKNLPPERELEAKLNEEKMSDREMDYAIRTTRERLDVLEKMLRNRKPTHNEDPIIVPGEL
ncbi:hypothetical protein ASPZODRAFT_1352582 [Penicilliopsis zonata CBS 506.65]|uniref:VASt domain-containing protein n=1 Tax=Penicilliopsis zonata CBS 506.65 TaxID=1073090 RepID=A0A1L9SNY8_9EURO|nr:hypothetical protein ASPZODRAFT_1352582 [Penicilliopsis zonata CBS 506.65]OJJ48918.1 hypothetical protein ASPZODRAFT_1352582 [Penicilliopsis zonata CBS 506.65]